MLIVHVIVRDLLRYKVCYYDSEIRPKLMDYDLGEGTYNESAYPLRVDPDLENDPRNT